MAIMFTSLLFFSDFMDFVFVSIVCFKLLLVYTYIELKQMSVIIPFISAMTFMEMVRIVIWWNLTHLPSVYFGAKFLILE